MPTITKTPGTITSNNAVGTLAWSNPSNAATDNNSYAEATLPSATSFGQSEYLLFTNFAGISIPNGSTVTNVTAKIRRLSVNTDGLDNYINDGAVREYYAGFFGSDLSDPSVWATSEEEISYTLTETSPAVLNTSSYGFGVSAAITNGLNSGDVIAQVDAAWLEITYTNPVPPPPFPGSGGMNTGAAFWMMLCAMPAFLLAFGSILSGLGVEPDRHPDAARPAFIVIPAADAVHILSALAARDFFAGPIHRSAERVLVPGRDIREVLALPGPLHQADEDQYHGDRERPKRETSTTSQRRHWNPLCVT